MKKEKITIGLFTDAFLPMIDGVGMVVYNYAKYLSKYANVIVFAPRYLNNKMDDSAFPFQVVRCESLKMPLTDYSLPVPKLDLHFEKKLKSYHLDIVHIHSPFTIGEVGVKYAKKNHIPVIGTMHSQYKQDFMRVVKNDFLATKLTSRLIDVFNMCDECWAVNKEVARIFYEDYGYKCMPRVFDNATEMEHLNDKDEAIKYINDKYNLKNEKVCLFVGRLYALKNIFFIVDVIKKVKELEPKLSFKMIFVGDGQDEDKLKEMIQDYHLEEDILLAGKVKDRKLLSFYYARSDLFVFPSIYDASSIVQIEAASQNTPTIFLKGTATSATVTDNVNGYIEEGDVTIFAKRIINILKNDQERKKIGDNAYRDLYRTWDRAIEDVYQNYLELIKKKL